MRKLLVAGLVLSALVAACETKSPVGPAGVTPTTSTTVTTTALTTTSSTTTSSLISSLALRFGAFPPQQDQPTEMTVFLKLLTSPPAAVTTGLALTLGQEGEPENQYEVTGVYVMGNGTTGTVEGILGGGSNPAVDGGTFEGVLTAKTPSGCEAEREFSGTLSPLSLDWDGVGTGTSTCSPSPLGFSGFSMLANDPNAPLPTPPSTTTSVPTTSTTTTSIVCDYSVSPTNVTVGSGGGTSEVSIETQSTCAWSAQSFADWITIQPPFGGTGSAVVMFTVQPNTTGASRTGRLLIAGQEVLVTQGTPPAPADLVARAVPEGECTFNAPTETFTWTANVANQGGSAAPASLTRIVFQVPPEDLNGGPQPSTDQPTGTVPAGGSVAVTFTIPFECFVFVNDSFERCTFTITADVNNAVTESNEANNGPVTGSCTMTPIPDMSPLLI